MIEEEYSSKKRQLDIAEQERRILNEEDKVRLSKVETLGWLLECTQVITGDIPGSEPMYRSLFSQEEKKDIKRKIFELLNEF